MKKLLIVLVIIIVVGFTGSFIWYKVNTGSVSKDKEEISFNISSGSSTTKIIEELKDANLIKSELATKIYVQLNDIKDLKAGSYQLNRAMDLDELFTKLREGGKSNNTFRLTFKEGYTLEDYVEQIAKAINKDKDELLKEINSEEFLKPLIEEHWFLTDDLLDKDVYYVLEGYLFPNTYEFYNTATLKDIVEKMLNETHKQLDPFRIAISESKYNVHEILTMASIIEKEALNYEDRTKVSQVIYTRLNKKMSLGMDVTSYYGVHKEMTEDISPAELDDNNPYNTRLTSLIGLPVGPICNPSKESIKAALNPSDTNYVYFYASEKTKKVLFTDNYKEFLTFKEQG